MWLPHSHHSNSSSRSPLCVFLCCCQHDAGDNAQGNIANTSYYITQDFIPLVAALRNTSYIHFTHAALPVVVGQMLPSWIQNVSHPLRQGVATALALVTQYVPYTGFADTYGLLGDPYFTSGLDNEVIHFTARSQRILGKRYHAAYQAALLNYPEQPPSSSSAAQRHHKRHAIQPPQLPIASPTLDLAPIVAQPAQPQALLPAIGVCMSGLEDGEVVPGVPGTNYAIPQSATQHTAQHSAALQCVP